MLLPAEVQLMGKVAAGEDSRCMTLAFVNGNWKAVEFALVQ